MSGMATIAAIFTHLVQPEVVLYCLLPWRLVDVYHLPTTSAYFCCWNQLRLHSAVFVTVQTTTKRFSRKVEGCQAR